MPSKYKPGLQETPPKAENTKSERLYTTLKLKAK